MKLLKNRKFASQKRCFLCDAKWQFFEKIEIFQKFLVIWVPLYRYHQKKSLEAILGHI
jgi:hypothetical protein